MLFPFILIISFALPCAAQRNYTITDLGTLGGSFSIGNAINNLGQVTGASQDALGRQRAFVYKPGQPLIDIGFIGNDRTLGTGINLRGEVSATELASNDPNPRAGLFYSPPNSVTRLVFPGSPHGEALAINNSGQVAGSSRIAPGGNFHAFRYTPGGGMEDLDPQSSASFASAINNFGVVAGSVMVDIYNSPAVVYASGVKTVIGTLAGWFANSRGINDAGQVVGDSLTSALQNHAFLYTPGSGMRDIGTLSPQDSSLALGINNAGEVVGVSGGLAFHYTKDQGMVDLNTRIPSGSGWLLTYARGINDLGQITGEGIRNGQRRAFVLTPVETPLYSGATRFVPVVPCRLVDTRVAGAAVAGGTIRRFALVSTSCNLPSGAAGYSLNVTVVPQGALSYLTIWPSGRAQPTVSTLNSFDGRIKANAAIVPAGLGGAVDVFATDTTDLVIDVNGYFVPVTSGENLAFYPVVPCRIADTRAGNGVLGGPSLNASQPRTFPVTASPCGIPLSARAYSLNFTSIPNGPLGYLTTWPTGTPQPLVSTLNAPTGVVTANAAIVPAGTNGSINVFATNASDLVIDVNGYFAPPGGPGAMSFFVLPPCRAADTRSAGGAMDGGETREFAVRASGCGVPASAAAYSLNATVAPRGALAYLTLSPFGQLPLASTLNAFDGVITSNAALIPAGTSGSIGAFVTNSTDLILDINGYFAQ